MGLFASWFRKRYGLILSLISIAAFVFFIGLLVSTYDINATFVPLGIAAISAVFAAYSAFANLLQAVETQKQREILERPYVIAHFDTGSSSAIYFVIKNYGSTPAKNVSVNIDPSPIDRSDRPLSEVSLIANTISFLPQQKMHRRLVDVGHRFLAADKNKKFNITVSYESLTNETFTEKFDEDLSYLVEATVPPRTIEESIAELKKELHDIKTLINRVISSDSLLVESPDQQRERTERLLEDGEI